jgi:uncharacterized protein (TIGR02145 family)
MKSLRHLLPTLLLMVCTLFGCQPETPAPAPDEHAKPKPDKDNKPPDGGDKGTPNTPFTSIPDALVGTWYINHNANPLTTNWEAGTFQGEIGFREFRTMVFTKDGKNAVEYTSWVRSETGDGDRYMFKRIGTLEYKTNPNTLTFHVQSGKVRHFSNAFTGYKEMELNDKDWPYVSVLVNPEATTYSSTTNYLTAIRKNGGTEYSVKYIKVDGNTPGGGTTDPGNLYAKPPASGSYVKIGNQYYPTVTIGRQEWMAVNYAGNGGIRDSSKPQFGTFYRYTDVKEIPIPAGWRLPTQQDYVALLQSQGLVLNEYGQTGGEDAQSKKLLGQLMATTGWLRQDGYATNKSGFNAVPANYKVQEGAPNGEGTNCFLWTSDADANEAPMAFQIIQFPWETFASFKPFPVTYYQPHLPVRLVKNQ